MLQSVRTVRRTGISGEKDLAFARVRLSSLSSFPSGNSPRLRSGKRICRRDEETRLRFTNRSGPVYAIFGPLAAMIRCRMCEFFARNFSIASREIPPFSFY